MTDPRGPRGSRRPQARPADGGSRPSRQGHPESPTTPDQAPPAVDPAPVEPAAVDPADAVPVDAVLAASRALLGVVAQSIAPVLEHVSFTQFRALVLLAALGPTRIGALAQRLGVHQSTFTRTTDRMVEAGLVRRADNPGNRREVLVEATDAGLAHVHAVTRRRREEIERVLRRLTPAERDTVRRALETFARAAGEPSVDTLALLGG